MLQCKISHSMGDRHLYTAHGRAFAQALRPLWLSGRDGVFCKAPVPGSSSPDARRGLGTAWEGCRRRVRMGGTVRFLCVEGMRRQVGLSDSFMLAPGLRSGSPVPCRNPGWWWVASLPSQGLENNGPSWERRYCCWCFHRKKHFVSFLIPSPCQSWNNALSC